MGEGISVLCALALISVTFAASLALGWHGFGRARHALTWALAFAVAAVQWMVNLLYLLLWPDVTLLRSLVGVLAVAVSALLLAGVRQRAGRPARPDLLTAVLGITALGIVAAGWTQNDTLALGLPLIVRPMLLVLAAGLLVRRGARPANRVELATAAALGGFALVSLAAGLFTLSAPSLELPGPLVARWILLIMLPPVLTAAGVGALMLLASDLADSMRRLATSDPLTGVLNRRGFDDAATRALASAARSRRATSVAILDIDRFKAINDQHGHAAGDRVLVALAEHVSAAVRTNDLFGRLGGEEFGLLLDGTSETDALDVLERIRAGLEATVFDDGEAIRLTASFGLAATAGEPVALDALVARADAALYVAKLDGRNCVRTAASAPTVDPGGAPAQPRAAASAL